MEKSITFFYSVERGRQAQVGKRQATDKRKERGQASKKEWQSDEDSHVKELV